MMQHMPLYMDNLSAIAQITSEASSLHWKVINIKYNVLKDEYDKN